MAFMAASGEVVGSVHAPLRDVPSILRVLSTSRAGTPISHLIPGDPAALAHALGRLPWPKLLEWGRFGSAALREALAMTTSQPAQTAALLDFWSGGFPPTLPAPTPVLPEAREGLRRVAQGPPGAIAKPPLPHVPRERARLARVALAAWGEWEAGALRAVAIEPFRRGSRSYYAYDALLSAFVHPELSQQVKQQAFNAALEFWRTRAGHKARRQTLDCLRWATHHGYVERGLSPHLLSHPPAARHAVS